MGKRGIDPIGDTDWLKLVRTGDILDFGDQTELALTKRGETP